MLQGWLILLLPILGIELHMTLIHVGVWWGDPRDRKQLWLAVWFALSAAFSLTRVVQLTAGTSVVMHLVRLQYALSLLLGAASLGFAYALAGRPLPAAARRGAAAAVPALLLALWLLDTSRPTEIQTLLGAPFPGTSPGWLPLGVGAVGVGAMVVALRVLRSARDVAARDRSLLTAALSVSTLAGMHDVAIFRLGLRSMPALDVGFLGVGLAFTWLLIHRYAQLAGGLESLVGDRTLELQVRSEELARARDAAERAQRLAEERASSLGRSELGLRALIESSPDGMAVRRDGTVLFANQRCLSLLRAPGAGTGSPAPVCRLEELAPPGDRAALSSALAACASSGTRAELELHSRSSRPVHCELAVVPTEYEGAPAELVVLRDQTERRELERRVQKSERLASLGALAASVGHEINNPLSLVSGNAALIREELARRGALAGGLGVLLEDVQLGAMRVAQIVSDLKALSRPGGAAPLTPTDPRTAAELALRLTRVQVLACARLTVDLQPTAPVLAEEAQLVRVLTHLVGHATQTLTAGPSDQHEIRVTVRPGDDGQTVAIEVTDDGPGIAPDALPHVFDPFFNTRDPGAGTGLGLSVAHSIVSSLGGTIDVDSADGRGTRVRVTLPSSGALPAAPAAPAPAADRPAGVARVLVIDDERPVARTLERILARHQVQVATSAAEALALVDGGAPFDVVFCDLMMPAMTGMELHEELSRRAPSLVPRMIFVTGGAFTDGAREFLERPGIRALYKPFQIEQVRELVRSMIPAAG